MKHVRLHTIAALLCLFCGSEAHAQQSQDALTVLGTAPVPNSGAVPNVVRFSGSFRPSNGMPAQPVAAQSVESVTLAVYRDQIGGTPLWQETQNVAVDAEGKYSVLMGATQNEGIPIGLFNSAETRWLGVQFNRPGEIEQPRVLLASVPYALKSVDAETLGGKPASAYLLAGAARSGTSSSGITTGTVATTLTTVMTDSTTAVKPRTISGQQGYVPYFTDGSNDLGDSVIQQSNGYIGVGTVPGSGAATTPSLDLRTQPFSQIGMAQTTDYLTFFSSDLYGPAIYWNPGHDLRFGKGGTSLYNAFGFTEQLRIQSATGNVGIGTQGPVAKLEVNGPVQADGNVTITISGNGLIFPDGSKQTTAAGGGGGGGSITGVTAGTDLTGGGTGGTVTLNLDTTKVPTLTGANTFTGSGNFFTTGNVGIGTATPGSKLDVAGDINFTGVVRYQGSPALQINSSPSFNVALGLGALLSNSSGVFNSAIGSSALASNTTGNQNTAVGYFALKSNNAGTANTGTGNGALTFNTTGNFNTAHGDHALYNNTTGADNTATGQGALFSNTIGHENTAIGYLALTNNVGDLIGGGADNTAIGANAMQSNTTGFLNTATGDSALHSNTIGYQNVATGTTALYYLTSGAYNTAVGAGALEAVTTGSYNVAVGYAAGGALSGANSANIDVGSPGTLGDNGTIRLGDPSRQTSFYAAGISGVTTNTGDAIPVLIDPYGQLGTVNSSRRFKEDIADMGEASHDLMRLRPVTYRYKKPFADGSKPVQYGLIAEEVDEVYPDLVAHSADGQIQTVKYQVLDSMLLNEVQRQQAEIRQLEERLAKLEAILSSTSAASSVPGGR